MKKHGCIRLYCILVRRKISWVRVLSCLDVVFHLVGRLKVDRDDGATKVEVDEADLKTC